MTYTLAPDLSVRRIEKELFVLDRSSMMIHSFNETGAYIWELLEKQLPVDAIANELTIRFDIDAEEAKRDLWEFIEALEKNGLIKVTTNGIS